MYAKHNLVNIAEVNSHIRLDIRYATTNNFTGEVLYAQPLCLFVPEVAEKLSTIQSKLEQEGLGLLIWDGYRPTDVQEIMRNHVPNDDFVARVSNHSRGIAVDLTLCDSSGNLLEMPTDFDAFDKEAATAYQHLPQKVLKNRNKLHTIMYEHGFSPIKNEWWHFNYLSLKDLPALNVPL